MLDIVHHVLAAQNILGEGPIWNAEHEALYWVDIVGQKINRLWPGNGKTESFEVNDQIGVIAFRENGGVIAAGARGFSYWKGGSNELEFLVDPEACKPGSRFNDGKVDRKGRFWAGTMTPQGAVSALYRLDADHTIHTIQTGITISNGIGWSLDNSIMYYVDSLKYVIIAFDFDFESGAISSRRDFVKVTEEYGIPDGLTVDGEGYIWCAFYGGGKVTRFDPQGNIDREIAMPVSNPTSCAFGGKNYDQLYVTSAWERENDPNREQDAMAGDLFMIETGIKGLPESSFGG
ncbi:MAG: SMP-30/gluconolactonase/LRE family protein [Anaerolineaceae bacterium]|nr:SMP-30/gluconolactonase/LRE family protein [Anaerolineaceae bacterium]